MTAEQKSRDTHKVSRSTLILLSAITIIGILTIWNISTLYSNSQLTSSLAPTGTITVIKNGQIVYTHEDFINYLMFNYIASTLFNESTNSPGYLNPTWYGSAQPNGCRTYSSSGTINVPNGFSKTTRCSPTGFILATDPNPPPNGALQPSCWSTTPGSIITGNGMDPIEASVSFAGGTATSVVLTGTWTATNTVNNINRVCLTLWNDVANALATSNPNWNILALENFPTQSLTTTQSLTIQWTFVF